MKNKKIFIVPSLIASFLTFSSMNKALNASDNSNYIDITFYLGVDKGVFRDTSRNSKTITVKKNLEWKNIKNDPDTPKMIDILYEEHALKCWTFNQEGTKNIKENDRFASNVTLYAQYTTSYSNISFSSETLEDDYEYPLDTTHTIRIDYGNKWSNIKNNYIPVLKSGSIKKHEFIRFYYMNGEDKITVDDNFEFLGTNDTTFYPEFKEYKAYEHFSTDSWETIIGLTKNGIEDEGKGERVYGLDALKYAYNNDIKDYGNTFVISKNASEEEINAKTRTVNINSFDYKVRVIGEKQDYTKYDSSKLSIPASLTFEFENVIADAKSYSFPYYSESITPNNSWKNSALRTNLYKNGDLYSLLPEILRKNIQPVYKKTYAGNGAPIVSFTYTKEYLFPLSASEIGFAEFSSKKIKPLDEGETYAYYNNEHYSSNNDKIKSDINSNTLCYHLRSPETESTVGAWYIDNEDGDPNLPMDVTIGIGVAPAFAIGIEKEA